VFQLAWQKSSFSEPGGDTCVELATAPTGRVHLRESEEPGTVVETTATALGALLRAVRKLSTNAAQG
jgi:hypothetical protein